MNGWAALETFLQTDPRDVGCAEALEIMDVYVELLQAGETPDERFPGVVVHLRACGPCSQDFDGLLVALERDSHA